MRMPLYYWLSIALFACAIVIGLIAAQYLRSRDEPTEIKEGTIIIDSARDGILTVRHRWRCEFAKGRKCESWLDGSVIPPWYPVPIWIRLTPEEPTDQEAISARVSLALVGVNGAVVRKLEVNPVWNACSKLSKRREINYYPDTRSYGPELLFPPKVKCWETLLEDPFLSDRRHAGTKSILAGDYSIVLIVQMDDVTFQLPNALVAIKS